MKLVAEEFLVGCPVYKRAWILPQWFDHVEKAAANAGVDPVYVFVLDDRDEETADAISNHNGAGYVFTVREPKEHDGERRWNHARYKWMATLRNELLGIVRLVGPHLFLSLDSDMLLHPDAIKNMIETSERADAVGGRAYMTETGRNHPSWSNISRNGGLYRKDGDGVFSVEIIMAIKLMKPSAYAIDYEFSKQGEDIGWSLACAKAGLKFLWDGRVVNKHVMNPGQLEVVDKRVGF